ncbi:MAG: PmoA family protein [Eudoraea sp.]
MLKRLNKEVIKNRFFLGIFLSLLSIACMDKKNTETKLSLSKTPMFSIESPMILHEGLKEGQTLYRKKGKIEKEIPVQSDGELFWFMSDFDVRDKSLTELYIKTGNPFLNQNIVTFTKSEQELHLKSEKTPLLSYRYKMNYPPPGVDSIYGKSAYVHPLLSPSGDTLTRIQPPDHYHHYGLWGPWTKTKIAGKGVDFWNLGSGQGTVLFKEVLSTYQGPLFAGFKVRQEHIDFRASPQNRSAIVEDLDIKTWHLNNQKNRYIVDYISKFSTPLEDGLLLEQYRYGGGLAMRFNERWKADNSKLLTSEGKDRLTADGTKARWCLISGESTDGKTTNGVLFLSHIENKSHPEPMRVWPIDANEGRGDMFFEFCPIRHQEWFLEKNKWNTLKYRLIVFEGTLTSEEAEAYWQSYVNPVTAKSVSD